MSVQELEAEALKLSVSERKELIQRLLARRSQGALDPLLGLGLDPVVCGVDDGSTQHDRYLDEGAC